MLPSALASGLLPSTHQPRSIVEINSASRAQAEFENQVSAEVFKSTLLDIDNNLLLNLSNNKYQMMASPSKDGHEYERDNGSFDQSEALDLLGQFRQRCKVPSISVGSILDGKTFWHGHVGFRKLFNDSRDATPDSKTVYTLASLSKPFVTQVFCMLVDEGKLRWGATIKTYLPDFKPKDNSAVAEATFNEVLRHSSGIDNPVVSWLGPHGSVLVATEEEFVQLLNDTPTHRNGKSLRNEYVYSNVAYGLVVLVIEKVSGTSFAELVQTRILNPLRMSNTAVTVAQVDNHRDNGNLAHTYAQMSDGSWTPLEHEWTNESNGPVLGMLGIRSSVEDMLKFYSAIMDAFASTASDEVKSRLNFKESSQASFEPLADVERNPLIRVPTMLDGPYWRFPCNCNKGESHNFYHHTPFVRAHLPCNRICWSSYNMTMANHPSTKETPIHIEDILGGMKDECLAYHFNGIGVAGTTSVKFFPESRSAVVAMASGINAGDAAEFACLMVVQKMFKLRPERSLLSLVEHEVSHRLQEFENTMARVEEHRGTLQPGTTLTDYVGVYHGLGVKLLVSASADGNNLTLSFNRKRNIILPLEPYGEDLFSFWPKSRDDWLAGGWLDFDHWDVALLGFNRSQDGQNKVIEATWIWEECSGPALFRRTLEEDVDGPAAEGGNGTPVERDKEVTRKPSICPMM